MKKRVKKRIISFLNDSNSIEDLQNRFIVRSDASSEGVLINDQLGKNILEFKESLSGKKIKSIADLIKIKGLDNSVIDELIFNFEKSHFVSLDKLKKKGINIKYSILDDKQWRDKSKSNLEIPKSYKELKRLGRKLFRKSNFHPIKFGSPSIGVHNNNYEECGEASYHNYFMGLGNPNLTPRQRVLLESDIDAYTPTFENELETENFILKWTNNSEHDDDNIADQDIIRETSEYLEEAWQKYVSDFGKTPYIPSGSSKIEVLFHDISALGIASPPDGPIQLDSKSWIDDPGIRQPTSAHELFHKLQYAFGYRTTHSPSGDYKWFSEGLASWAEVFVWNRVSRSYKIRDLFENPDRNLFASSYRALPFWMFFEKRQKESHSDNPVVDFLDKYEDSGDEKESLIEVIQDSWQPGNIHRSLGNFFALFSRERKTGAWKTGNFGSYNQILGPDDNAINPVLNDIEIIFDAGDNYNTNNSVEILGADYYNISLNPTCNGRTIQITSEVIDSESVSYILMFFKDNTWIRAIFPPGNSGSYSYSELIDLNQHNSMVLIVSSKGFLSNYSLEIEVTDMVT